MTKDEAIQSFQVLNELRTSGKLPPDQQKVVEDACKGIVCVAKSVTVALRASIDVISAKHDRTEIDRIRNNKTHTMSPAARWAA